MIVVVYKYQKWTAPRTSHFGGTRVNVFVRDCETLGSESERLLQHSYHILKLRQCDGTEHRKKKKSLSLQLKSTVDSLREKHSGAVLIIHTLDETHRYVPLLRTMPITFTCSQTSQRPIWATVKNITEQLFTHQYFANVYQFLCPALICQSLKYSTSTGKNVLHDNNIRAIHQTLKK